jgi:uncharacterized protein YpmS
MKWVRRILLLIAIVLCLVVAAAIVGIHLYRGTPSWYRTRVMSEEEQKATANRADQKMADAISWAASVQAQAVRRLAGTAATHESPVESKTITISEDELNAFFDSWQNSDKLQLQRRLSRYFTDGRVVLVDHEIILAGESKELGTVASVHLAPSIDEAGQLHLQWNGVSAGLLPVPQSAISGQLQKLQETLQDEMSFWRRSADVDKTFSANTTAVETGMTRLLLDALNNRVSNPIAFVPFDLRDLSHALVVRLSAIEVSDGSLTVTLQPLGPDDRQSIRDWIQKPYADPNSGQ